MQVSATAIARLQLLISPTYVEFNNTLQLSTSSTNYYLPAFLMNPGSFLAPHAIMWSLEALFPF